MVDSNRETKPVLPTLQVFAICYALLSLTGVAIVAFLKLPPNAGLFIGVLVGAATFAASRFHAAHGRVANGGEQFYLVLGSLVISLLFSAATLLVTATSQGLSERDLVEIIRALAGAGTGAEWAMLAATVIGFTTAALWVSYGPLARIMAGSGGAQE